ncbi:MAG: hypothetical protein HKN98_02005, partial [Silicimonas sp.]|nr:hypothetical protein [Silicimonas sp.]
TAAALYGATYIFPRSYALTSPKRQTAGRSGAGTAAFGLDSVPRPLDPPSVRVHLCSMGKKTTATVSRNAKAGKFTIRKSGGGITVLSSDKKTPKTVSASIGKNRDALKRLADR